MPIYTFRCRKHGEINITLGMEEERPTQCPECGEPITRVFHAQNVVYRAGGFQATDKRLEPKEDDYDAYDV